MQETTTTTAPTVSWFQDAMKNGLILGIIHIILFLIIYYVFPNKLTGFSYLIAIMVINIGYCTYQGIQWRNELGGYMSYGTGFKYSMVVLLTNGVIGTIFTALFLLVEPSMPDIMAQSQLDTSIYWAQKFGAPESATDEITSKFNPEDITKRFTFLGMLTGFGIVTCFYIVGSLIIALFTRKNEPVEL